MKERSKPVIIQDHRLIRDYSHDFSAHREGAREIMGWGATDVEAIKDLQNKENRRKTKP